LNGFQLSFGHGRGNRRRKAKLTVRREEGFHQFFGFSRKEGFNSQLSFKEGRKVTLGRPNVKNPWEQFIRSSRILGFGKGVKVGENFRAKGF